MNKGPSLLGPATGMLLMAVFWVSTLLPGEPWALALLGLSVVLAVSSFFWGKDVGRRELPSEEG